MLVLSRQRDETIMMMLSTVLSEARDFVQRKRKANVAVSAEDVLALIAPMLADIEVTVVDIRGDKTRLGITAPKDVPVHRKEVYDAIQRENREAAKVAPVPFVPPVRPTPTPLMEPPKPSDPPKAS